MQSIEQYNNLMKEMKAKFKVLTAKEVPFMELLNDLSEMANDLYRIKNLMSLEIIRYDSFMQDIPNEIAAYLIDKETENLKELLLSVRTECRAKGIELEALKVNDSTDSIESEIKE